MRPTKILLYIGSISFGLTRNIGRSWLTWHHARISLAFHLAQIRLSVKPNPIWEFPTSKVPGANQIVGLVLLSEFYRLKASRTVDPEKV